jgi:hypothetical protein
MLGLGEAGVIPCLRKFLGSDQLDFALPILRYFENRKEYYSQLYSIGLLNLARVSHKCETLFTILCHHASPEQLIPVFSFFLSQLLFSSRTQTQILFSLIDSPTLDLTHVLPKLDVGKILCPLSDVEISQEMLQMFYKILSSIYLRDSMIVPNSHLLSWQSFLSQVPQDNFRMELICPILTRLITNCADLKTIIDHGMISSLFSRVQSPTCDRHFLRWLLDLIFHATVRAKDGGREEAVLFLDHLVDLGIFSFLSESPQKDGFQVLKMLFRFDKKYQMQFKQTPIMKGLFSLFEDDANDNSGEQRTDDPMDSKGESCEAQDQDLGLVKKRKREDCDDE